MKYSFKFVFYQISKSATFLIYRGAPASKDENGNDKIQFVYVPSHLYHVLFELFKNAMRATIEHAGEDEINFPSIKGKNINEVEILSYFSFLSRTPLNLKRYQ